MKINLITILGESFPAVVLFVIACVLGAILLQLCCMQDDTAERLEQIHWDVLSLKE